MKTQWKKVAGFEMYLVSSNGDVYSSYSDRVLVAAVSKGYRNVTLYRDGKAFRKRIACLVAEAFFGAKPEGFDVCHGNGVRDDDRLSNLRYDTRSNNFADKKQHGTYRCGIQMPWTKYSERQVRIVRKLISYGFLIKDAAFIAGVREGTAYQINSGVSWSRLR